MAQENLSDIISKRFGNSLTSFLKLVDPERKYAADINLSKAWSRLTLEEQRRLYLYLLYRKWQGIAPYGTPYEMVTGCHPCPTNWNGKPMLNRLMKESKLVRAKYDGAFGIYTADEARVWQMSEVKALNF